MFNLKNRNKIESFRDTVPLHVTTAVYSNYLSNENEWKIHLEYKEQNDHRLVHFQIYSVDRTDSPGVFKLHWTASLVIFLI